MKRACTFLVSSLLFMLSASAQKKAIVHRPIPGNSIEPVYYKKHQRLGFAGYRTARA